jgi:T4-like virus Myoviridae tail sheath stabiliser
MISGPNPFYNSLFKKYVAIFGTLFNSVYIQREDSTGAVIQTIKVPIAYGPRDKFLARAESNPTGSAVTEITLPRMAFEIDGISYAPNRKLQTLNKTFSKKNINGQNVYKKVFSPAPYDIGMRLQILSKTMEDGLKIVEQILPYFTPEWTITAELLGNDFDMYTDIPIVLNSVQIEDQYTSDFTQRQVLTFTLNFTIKAYFYGPVAESKLIKITEVKLYADMTANSGATTTIIRPGLTPDGLPTSNAALSLAISQIDEGSDFGFIINTTQTYSGSSNNTYFGANTNTSANTGG